MNKNNNPTHSRTKLFSNNIAHLLSIILLSLTFLGLDSFSTSVAQAQSNDQTTWYLEGVTFESGTTAKGSFKYNEVSNSYSNIEIVVNKDGERTVYRLPNPNSPGNEIFLSGLPKVEADLTGLPFIGMVFEQALTSAGGTVGVVPGASQLSLLGSCGNETCTSIAGPFDRVVAGQVTTSPTWYLEGVTFESGATARGSFKYNEVTNRYSNIEIVVNKDGERTVYRLPNPNSPGNEIFLSGLPKVEADLTGLPFIGMVFEQALTSAGGTIGVVPGASQLSLLGSCGNETCTSIAGPFDRVVAGQVTTSPTWYLEGVTFESGATAKGSFKYNEVTNRYSNIEIVVNKDGERTVYRLPNPNSPGNEIFLSGLPKVQADLTGLPFIGMVFEQALTSTGGTVGIVPGASQLSLLGSCGNETCTSIGGAFDRVVAGQVTTNPTWYLEGVTFESGATARGSFKYNEVTNSYSNIEIVVNKDGERSVYHLPNPNSPGNEIFLSGLPKVQADLTGLPFIGMVFEQALTSTGGTVGIVPGASQLSLLGSCSNETCTSIGGVFDRVVAGQVTTLIAAPEFTSSNAANVLENQTAVIDVEATDNFDSEGNGLRYQITGGSDQDLFSIQANSGLIAFIFAPDFESPSDADSNNDYDLEITVTDSTNLLGVQNLTITVTDVDESDPQYPPANTFTIFLPLIVR